MPKTNDKRAQALASTFGEAATSYLDCRITDTEYINALRRYVKQLAIGGDIVEARVAQEHVYDLGGDTLNDSLTVALLDLEASPQLLEALSNRFRSKVTKETTAAALFTRRYLDFRRTREAQEPVFGQQRFVLIQRFESATMSVHVLADSHLRTLLYKHVTADAAAKRSISSDLDARLPHAHRRLMGAYQRILVERDGAWVWATVTDKSVLPSDGRRQRVFTATEYVVAALGATEDASESTRGLPLASVALSASDKRRTPIGNITVIAGAIGVSTGGGDGPPQEGGYRYGPPDGGGVAGCTNYGNPDDCKNCCIAYLSTASTAIGIAATACAAKTGWPFMLVCFAAATIAQGIVWYYFEECKDNCDQVYWNEDYIAV